MDLGTRIITVVSTIIVTAAGIVGFVALQAVGHWGRWVLLAVAFVPAVAFARAPSAYVLDGSTLTVRSRWGGTRRFSVTDADVATGGLESLGLRLMGNGGPFGWTGTFTFPARGRAQLYLTDRDRIVWFEFPDDRPSIGISPRDPDALIGGWSPPHRSR